MFNEIIRGAVHFDDDPWPDVSNLAKSFITDLLMVNPLSRLTPEEALKHPWLNQPVETSVELLPSIQRFIDTRKIFKKAANVVIGMNRMKKMPIDVPDSTETPPVSPLTEDFEDIDLGSSLRY